MSTKKVKVYQDLRDWWIGYYRGDEHHYVCPLPTLVIRWPRKFEPCDGTWPHAGPWEHIPGSDQASRCACGFVSGK